MKDTENGPVVVTRNGRPAAMMIAVGDDQEELERLVLAYSPKFRQVLERSRQQIRETGGVDHETFWQEIDEAAPGHRPPASCAPGKSWL